MTAKTLISLFVLIFVSKAICLDLMSLEKNCMEGKSLNETEKVECVGGELKMYVAREGNETFYCINYEKNTGNRYSYDVLSFELNEDYVMLYVS